MADIYMNLSFNEYKEMESQMIAFNETSHGEGTEYYHHSIRINIGELTIEFHGPVVKARQMELEEVSLKERAISSSDSSTNEDTERIDLGRY